MKTILFFTSLLLSLNVFSATIYVDINATGSNNGTSWANAYNDLQSALSFAFLNDEIWVATGFYHPTSTTNRDISFVMKNGIDIYGGFAGTETNINQRIILANPTTLTGDIGQPGDNTDNTRKVVKVQNFTTDFTMDGFRVISGYDASSSGKGAGMYMYNNSGAQITINNCIFYNNYAYHSGGGLIVDDTHVTFNECEFLYNSSYNYGGGAIYSANVSNSDIYLNDSKLIGNNSRDGAAINFGGYTLKIERCLISNNTSTQGDILDIDSGVDTFVVNNSLLIGNLLNDAGSSLISIYSSSPACSITNSTICHNKNDDTQTPYAEMIHRSNGALQIYNSIVFGNTNSDQNLQIDPGNNVINSIIENGYTPGTNVITSAPNFASPGSLVSAPFDASSMDYSLLLNSPGINSGDNIYSSQFTFDYELNARIQQINVDCGAIESPFSDTQAPTAICNDTIVYLDLTGAASLDYLMIDDGSYDNIGISLYALSNSVFNCSDIGTNSVTLTVSDDVSNSDMCTSTVTVLDTISPTIIGQNISIDLDPSGNATILASQIENGSNDNCGISTISISPDTFSCSDLGNNNVTLTVEDLNGNISNAIYVVNINDTVAPIAIAQDITIYLSNSGNASVSPSTVNNGSSDNCSIFNFNVSPSNYSCASLGIVPAIFTATDSDGNSDTDDFNVTVLDTIRPIVLGANIQVNLATSNPYIITPADINSGSNDNCNFNLSIDLNSFNSVGIYDVNLTATDDSGNFDTETYQVEVIHSDVGLEENESNAVKYFPNPVINDLTIILNSTVKYSFILYSSEGRKVKTWDSISDEKGAVSIDFIELTDGFYTLDIKSDNELIQNIKLLKNH